MCVKYLSGKWNQVFLIAVTMLCRRLMSPLRYEGISAYVDASKMFALIGNFLDIVDRVRKRAYFAVREHG